MVITKAQLKKNIATTQPSTQTSAATGQPHAEQLPDPCALRLALSTSELLSIERCIKDGSTVEVLFGRNPVLKYGNTSKALQIRTSKHHQSLYNSSRGSTELLFAGQVGHEVTLEKLEKASVLAEAAAKKLKDSLDAYQRDRSENETALVSNVKPNKHGRVPSTNLKVDALRLPTLPSSPSNRLSTPSARPTVAPRSSAPPPDPQSAARARAQSFCLTHLLASKPFPLPELLSRTRIPHDDCTKILDKVAEREGDDWRLKRKTYRQLDIWRFPYPSEGERQSAIDNALRAFDRDRLDASDPIRQLLLPKAERGKGKNPSNLHIDMAAVNDLARKQKAADARATSDHRKLLAHAGNGTGKPRSPSQATRKSAAVKESATRSPRPSSDLASSPALTAVKKDDGHKQKVSKPKAVVAASLPMTLAQAKDNQHNATNGVGLEKKRKAQPVPKSSEFIHDSDEDAAEADRAAKKRMVKSARDGEASRVNVNPERSTTKLGAKNDRAGAASEARARTVGAKTSKGSNPRASQTPLSEQDAASKPTRSQVTSAKQEHPSEPRKQAQLLKPQPQPRPAKDDSAGDTSQPRRKGPTPSPAPSSGSSSKQPSSVAVRWPSTSSASASSPLTPLDRTPQSTVSSTSKTSSDVAHLEQRYQHAFRKLMHAMFVDGDDNRDGRSPAAHEEVTAAYEQSATELAGAMGVHVEDLYVPAGSDVFPSVAVETLANQYNDLFPAYQSAKRKMMADDAGFGGGDSRRKALCTSKVLQKRLKYVRGLYNAAVESRRMAVVGE